MPKKYNSYLEINPSFESVVDIDADKRNGNLWREYIVGKDMEDLMEAMCQSLNNEAPDARRSFWIHGSYGTGKSYAGIFVKHLMEEKPEVVEDFMSKNARLSKYKNRFMKCRNRGGDYLVVWKTGCTGIRTGDMMVIEAEKAIRDALIEKYGVNANLGSASLMDAVITKLDDPTINWDFMLSTTILGDEYDSVEDLTAQVKAGDLTAIQNVASVLRQKNIGMVNNLETFKKWIEEIVRENNLSKSGIIIIWDEFTEYVAYSDDHIIMQQLSEFSKVQPLFMFYIVHKSTDLVARMGGDEQYEHIADRFHNIEFHLTADASLDLIAGSINTCTGMEEHWKQDRKQVIANIHSKLADMTMGVDDRIAEMIEMLCPMHPMTIRLLSRVAENYAAAERTMFRFMKDRSNEEIGFVGYINKYGPEDEACWLTPEWLWDYFFTRESDFRDKDVKVAEYIRHYEDSRHLVESDEDAHRLFKVAMLLLAVMSSAKGIYSGSRAHGGIEATQDCLVLCLAGVMSEHRVKDLLQTLQENKLIVLDEAANGKVRLQLPFKNDGGSFQMHYDQNDKKYSRYQMFSKDGVWAQEFEKLAWDTNDATYRRMKIAVCCAETNSIKARLDEVTKELEKNPYKLGLLIVVVRDDAQAMAVTNDLQKRAQESDQPRLTIALLKDPLTDETRKKWLNAITKLEMANESGQTGAAGQAKMEASTVITTWVQQKVSGGKMIAWNGLNVFNNQYGPQLRKTIQVSVLGKLFPYAPETVVTTNTAYKPCNDSAPLAGIQRTTTNSQLKSVLTGLGNLQIITNIDEMAQQEGNKTAESIAHLAKLVRDEMTSGQKVVLSDLWAKLMQPPFGYYDTIACGVILGYVFTGYKDGKYSWTDSSTGVHLLSESNLKTMVLNMVKGKMSTDYLSSGTKTFQLFSEYIQKIMGLKDVQAAEETECWRNMRESITKTGAPFWTLKYLPDETYGSDELKQGTCDVVDEIQKFIMAQSDREGIMGNVNQLLGANRKARPILTKAFQDKHVMSSAFRSFLFDVSPELKEIASKLTIQPEELGDKLHAVMQGAIYTWTEEQVKDKLTDVVSEYRYLDALNYAIGKTYHSVEDARKELKNLFGFVHIPLAALEKLDPAWLPALQAMYKVSRGAAMHMTQEERSADAAELSAHGKAAMDFLKDGKPALSDILERKGQDVRKEELDSIYQGLRYLTIDTSLTQFENELKSQLGYISHARNRVMLLEHFRSMTGVDTVKDWCAQHGAPLLWIVSKEQREAFATVIKVSKDQRTVDSDVVSADAVLKAMDQVILSNDQMIAEAFIKKLGDEYRDIFEAERAQLLAKAKMKLGNDMSTWDVGDVQKLQQLLKEARQEKAKREKLSTTKSKVQSMNEAKLRSTVQAFLDAHPEFCDDFNA